MEAPTLVEVQPLTFALTGSPHPAARQGSALSPEGRGFKERPLHARAAPVPRGFASRRRAPTCAPDAPPGAAAITTLSPALGEDDTALGAAPTTAPAGRAAGPLAGLKDAPTDAWYCVGESRDAAAGKLMSRLVRGDQVVVGRTDAGALFALRDRCPHRGTPLSKGKFEGGEIACPFHGWRFRPDGACAGIPGLSFADATPFDTVSVPRYPVTEVAGMIWVFHGRGEADAPPVPDLDFEATGKLVVILEVEASYDLVALSFVDPAHVAHVHDSWWWRSSKALKEKVKRFEPSPYGFTMTSHGALSASAMYRLLGGAPETEIEFRLPGVRLERIRAGKRRIANYTYATPLTERRTALINVMYWNIPLLNLLKPVARPFARQFLGQDQTILALAQDGIDRKPSMVLLGQSDLPAQWYFALKRERLAAAREGRPFANPLEPRELRWRS